MKIKIEFETGNDAFEQDGPGELSRVLERIREIIEGSSNKNSLVFSSGAKLRDSNGATIGKVRISDC